MRRVLIAVFILVLPTAVALTVYYFSTRIIPTNPNAIGKVETLAGSGSPFFKDDKPHDAGFADPFGIAIDKKGNVLVADGGSANRIRRIDTRGHVETIAGSDEGFADGAAAAAQFNTPSHLSLTGDGDLVIADTSNNRIRKLTPKGQVVTLAGSGETGYRDGKSSEAQFDAPIGVAADQQGNIFVADTYNDRIRKITAQGEVLTIAGSGTQGLVDGDALSAQFNTPVAIAIDSTGDLLVADTGNSAIRKVTRDGIVTTIASRSDSAQNGRGRVLTHPEGICVTADDFVFVSCEDGIFRIDPLGNLLSYAGARTGFAEGTGSEARFNGPSGIAVDREGTLFVADTQNHLIRMILAVPNNGNAQASEHDDLFVQPRRGAAPEPNDLIPAIHPSEIDGAGRFPWPLAPQNKWHEIAGVVGEARGAPGGIALDHLHSGLDIRGAKGERAFSVLNEKVSSPRSTWGFGGDGEGLAVGLFTYIHIRVGRDDKDVVEDPSKFKPERDPSGRLTGVRVRRGTRFTLGDFVGSVNRLNHVHLNLGPWSAQANAIALGPIEFKDTVPPVIEPNGISVIGADGKQLVTKQRGRLWVSGDVSLLVTAYDKVDGNLASRKLGLYRVGYQILKTDGSPAPGFEEPLMNLEFDRLPPDDASSAIVYAPGSGVMAYGTPTRFTYIVTNLVRGGRAERGVLRTSLLSSGDYTIRVLAFDYAGNKAEGPATELPIVLQN
ncbi:MAG TPA: NHL repeat-containing protein [Blastocatellia bacterium]|nr:NHL repeat-containing protein [Blastocatellia bacterium]